MSVTKEPSHQKLEKKRFLGKEIELWDSLHNLVMPMEGQKLVCMSPIHTHTYKYTCVLTHMNTHIHIYD